jgi:hypothetical protein
VCVEDDREHLNNVAYFQTRRSSCHSSSGSGAGIIAH